MATSSEWNGSSMFCRVHSRLTAMDTFIYNHQPHTLVEIPSQEGTAEIPSKNLPVHCLSIPFHRLIHFAIFFGLAALEAPGHGRIALRQGHFEPMPVAPCSQCDCRSWQMISFGSGCAGCCRKCKYETNLRHFLYLWLHFVHKGACECE